MHDPENFLSDKISQGLVNVYKSGSLSLSFLYLGAVLMLMVVIFGNDSWISYMIAVTGFILINFVVLLYWFKVIKPIQGKQRLIRENEELIDTVQVVALQLTELSYELQSLLFKHATIVSSIINL